jgi:hypothetical protein
VRERQPFEGPLRVRFAAREHTIGGRLAHAMRVELDRAAAAGPDVDRDSTPLDVDREAAALQAARKGAARSEAARKGVAR